MYIPLHVHSRFSLLDSLIDVNELACRAKELGMPAVAVTDHGALYGLIYFYKACKKAGVKPILGMELYVRPSLDAGGDTYHLVVLAKDRDGYRNLVKLATAAALGSTQRAIADHAMLQEYGRGLVATSACLAGEIPQAVLAGDLAKAEETALYYSRVFDGFYLELGANSIPEQAEVNAALVEMSRRLGVPLVASSDAHYLLPEDAATHDVLLAVQTHKLVSDTKRLRFSARDFWVMSEDEIREHLASSGVDAEAINEALANTVRIANGCNVVLDLGSPAMPTYVPTEEEVNRYGDVSAEAMLSAMAYDGLKRLGLENDDAYLDRMREELSVICDAGFAGYFLIVQDIVNWAKRNGIMVGPGRGSVGGSLVAYLLGITEVDPIEHNLIFERFLNRERAMSDYDWTFKDAPPSDEDDKWRADDIEFVRDVGDPCIVTEAAWEYEQMNRQHLGEYYLRLAREGCVFEENEPQSWLAYVMGIAPEPASLERTRLRVIRQGSQPDIDVDIADDERQKVLEYIIDRYGHDRVAQIGNITTMGAREALRRVAKAFGFTPAQADSLSALVPKIPGMTLERALQESRELMQECEVYPEIFVHAQKIEGCASTTSIHAAGVAIAPCEITELVPLHKGAGGEIVTQYDMNAIGDLVLKVDILGLKTLSVIRRAMQLAGKDIEALKRVPLDDGNVYEMLSRGDTDGVFQVSSRLFKGLLKEVKPTCFEDLVAVLSLGRPGPGSMAETYIKRRKGEEPVEYPDERLEPILADTYGIPLYQEQVMRMARDLAGYTLGQADILRKAMGKKIPEVMEKERARFVEGCVAHGIAPDTAERLFDDIAEFAGYGFNRSHSLEYAIITYWTAVLKLYYPAEFLTACLTDEASSSSPARHGNIAGFLGRARALGIAVLLPDVNKSERGFSVEVLDDGTKAIRIGLEAIDGLAGKAIEHLLEKRPFTGVVDMLERCNPQIINVARVKSLIYAGAFDWEDEDRYALFRLYLEAKRGDRKNKKIQELLSSIPEHFSKQERVKCETASLGYVVSDIGSFASTPDGGFCLIRGVAYDILAKCDKRGRDMCFMSIATDEGEDVRVVVFANVYRKARKLIDEGATLVVYGRRDDASLIADEVEDASSYGI